LLADSLDRIGRKGLEREIYRAQLREKGMRILTTNPSEHADDDSRTGEIIRTFLGMNFKRSLHQVKRAPEEVWLILSELKRHLVEGSQTWDAEPVKRMEEGARMRQN
jgi:hypothetical protein